MKAPDTGWWVWRLLFPSRCLGCDRRGSIVCADCLRTIPYLPAAVCYRCCSPSAGGRLCRRCLAAPGSLSNVRAACTFQGVVRRGIHAFKYRAASSLAPFLADLMMSALARRPADADLLVPVPLAPDRLRQRGYNQAALLAHQLAARLSLPVAADALVRNRATRPQVELAGTERRANLRGAFSCPEPDHIAGRAVLLVDDVTTTGSTLEACAEALTTAGATRVMAVTVAKEL